MNYVERAAFATLVVLLAAGIGAAGDAEPAPSGKLMVVWTSADPDVADKVCLMYAHAAKRFGWFAEVTLVVWGPSQRLLAGDPSIQAKVKAMQDDGVIVEACVACATKLGLIEKIEALGIEVRPMGVPLTEALKDPATEVLTF
jgi:hypothetical protein